MLYLLDANVIIDAKDTYYAIDRVPQFWEWLVHHGNEGRVKVPLEMFEEVSPGRDKEDRFYKWRKDQDTAAALVLDEEADPLVVQRVLEQGYGARLTDEDLITIGKDPFLIAYALVDFDNRTVVTSEASKPTQRGKNAKIPDVCDALGVTWIDEFEFYKRLDFRINWRG